MPTFPRYTPNYQPKHKVGRIVFAIFLTVIGLPVIAFVLACVLLFFWVVHDLEPKYSDSEAKRAVTEYFEQHLGTRSLVKVNDCGFETVSGQSEFDLYWCEIDARSRIAPGEVPDEYDQAIPRGRSMLCFSIDPWSSSSARKSENVHQNFNVTLLMPVKKRSDCAST